MKLQFNNTAELVLVTFVAVLLLVTNSSASKRFALVVGNSNYENASSLKNPVNDAELMEKTLKQAGFKVTKVLDADYQTLKQSLLEFGRKLYKEPEAGLFYYAGHGIQVRGENYLVPVDAKIEKEDEVDFAAIPVNHFLRVMNSSNSGINIVILDACRNNPFARSFRTTQGGLAPVDAPKGTYIAYATAPGDVAADGKGLNSPYTKALSKALTIRGITIEKAFKTARLSVLEETDDVQVPWETSSITGDFYFLDGDNNAAAAVKDKTPNPPLSPAERAYELVKESRDLSLLRAYVAKFPDSFYATVLSARIQELEKSKTIATKAKKKTTIVKKETSPAPVNSSLSDWDRKMAEAEAGWKELKNSKDKEKLQAFADKYFGTSYSAAAARRMKDL